MGARSGSISVLGVPIDLGAGRRGVDMGPSALRVAGIGDALRSLGHSVEDLGDLPVKIPETQAVGDPHLKYLREIRDVCELLRDRVAAVLERASLPLVLGGDHSIAIGTLAGLARHHAARGERLGVIWIDAHADSNCAESSPSGNIHGMSLAVALGIGPAELTGLGGTEPMVEGSRAAVIGVRSVDAGEAVNVRATGVGAYTMRDVDERGMRAVMEDAIRRASSGTAGIHVSLDLDSLDPEVAPGVGTPISGGLSYREAHLAMEMLADTGRVISAELVEVNPVLDTRNRTAALAVELVTSLLGKRIL